MALPFNVVVMGWLGLCSSHSTRVLCLPVVPTHHCYLRYHLSMYFVFDYNTSTNFINEFLFLRQAYVFIYFLLFEKHFSIHFREYLFFVSKFNQQNLIVPVVMPGRQFCHVHNRARRLLLQYFSGINTFIFLMKYSTRF